MEIGTAIKALRLARGLTLDALAGRSGVSRAMLSEVERGVKNPTIRVAGQIAEALETTISALLGETPPPDTHAPHVTRRAAQRTLLDPHSGVTRQSLAPAYAARGVEVLRYHLPPGATTGTFPPHRPGTVEQLTVIAGQLACTLGAHEPTRHIVLLEEGDALFFEADLAHTFTNPGPHSAHYLLIIDASQARASR